MLARLPCAPLRSRLDRPRRARARKGAGANEADGIVVLRHHPGFQLVPAANVEKLRAFALAADFLGDGQRRIDVATGATTGEQIFHVYKVISTRVCDWSSPTGLSIKPKRHRVLQPVRVRKFESLATQHKAIK